MAVTLAQSGKNQNVYSTSPLTANFPSATSAGDTLVVMVTGAKLMDPYAVSGLAAATTAPTISNNGTLATWNHVNEVNFVGDPGYSLSLYLFYAVNVAAGITSVTLTDLDSNGRPVFNGGVNIHAYNFTGTAVAPVDGTSVTVVGYNSNGMAQAPAIVTTATNDLIFTAGLMYRSGEFGLINGYTYLHSGNVIGTPNDHFMTAYAVQPTSGGAGIKPGFLNPGGYKIGIASLALLHS